MISNFYKFSVYRHYTRTTRKAYKPTEAIYGSKIEIGRSAFEAKRGTRRAQGARKQT